MRPLILGTRGSALALAQTDIVRTAIRSAFPDQEMITQIITTTGDSKVDMSLIRQTPAGAKGLFTKEIEDLLLDRTIDFAVHSLKDLAGVTSDGLEIVAVLERAPVTDVLITKKYAGLDALPDGAVIGTSSVRRARQLQALRPDLTIVEHRGNVPTRLKKLVESTTLDGIVLARAGLVRLGYDPEALSAGNTLLLVEDLGDKILPAIGQGAIALQCRNDDTGTRQVLEAINHLDTFRSIRAERELLRLLNGDCQLPVGVRTSLKGETLSMEAVVFESDGIRRGCASGNSAIPEKIAATVFKSLARDSSAG